MAPNEKRSNQRALPGKARRPDEADLAKVLGRAKRHWDRFMADVRRECPEATVEWKHYATVGWRLLVRQGRRNLAYLKPSEGSFTASFALGDDAVDAAERSDLPWQIVAPLRESPKYPEGRAVRIDVASSSDAAVAAKLLAIKVATLT